MIEHAVMPSALGDIVLRAESDHLTGVFFHDQKHFPPSARGPMATAEESRSRVIRQTCEALKAYLAGARQRFDLPLSLPGSPFQQRVWQRLDEIEFGEVLTYGALAHSLGLSRGHARAVGSAVGRNPVSIIVPCHRVLAGNGTLNGYAGGLERKAHLLALEGRPEGSAGLRQVEGKHHLTPGVEGFQ
ncbi:methylated-DNA--[protein]-cysteine S-methyltransferase [Kushneria indalinina]|uniref:Methylated-DNA--protein-cysteine methyltransferase n=1 Tax=Kushneria indalinina DSM 14324 TaxID=1122140 RepID=A0A3D9DUM9_9GAMM|nr:methylated-DNA--[protein]-cysteine S-methyltransferase [Kushneria indalinina]REC94391.1 methylated-DNA-[protein]-cysteine S-methyltransferase [Kushneria indalinina DSM 14324]